MDATAHRAAPERPLRTILRYNAPYWKDYLIGVFLSAIYVVVGLAMPLVLRRVVGDFEQTVMTNGRLAVYFLLLVGVAAIVGFARYFERLLVIGASRKCEYDLRNDFFRHIQSMSREFFHRNQTGDLMARATNDLNYIRMFMGPGIMGTMDMIQLPLTLGLMVYLSWRLTLFSLIPLPLVSVLVYAFVMYMHRQTQRVQDQYGVVTNRAQENLAGARVVQAYGISDRENEFFRRESQKYMRENMKLASVISLAWPLIGFIVAMMILLVIWRGGVMVIYGTLGLDNLTAFVVTLLMLVWPLAELGWILTLYQRGAAGMKRMNEIFAQKPAIADSPVTHPHAAITSGAIEFQGVSFAYNQHEVLHDIHFAIQPAQTVAIVGPTGAGKSSIVSLIVRDYDPTAGHIFIDGTDLSQLPIQSLRAAIGYVPQDTFLFSDTVRSNIAFGRPDATDEQINVACDIAQLEDTISSLPNGYETLLGERGVNLSGGQKQRVALARAILKDPKILILDDALSSVDTHTEFQILRRLRQFMKNRTSIIISHRISAVQDADVILVIEDGRIVQRGDHTTLVSRPGLYASLYERQLLEQELEQE